MRRTLGMIALVGLLLVTTFCRVNADFLRNHGRPLEPTALSIVQTSEGDKAPGAGHLYLNVTWVAYEDGFVQWLDTTHGFTYSLWFSVNGKTAIMTQFDSNGNVVNQWISDAN